MLTSMHLQPVHSLSLNFVELQVNALSLQSMSQQTETPFSSNPYGLDPPIPIKHLMASYSTQKTLNTSTFCNTLSL